MVRYKKVDLSKESMNLKYLYATLACLIFPLMAERYLVDTIDVVIMGHQQMDTFVELIMRSDTERPNLLGQMISLEDLVQEACYYLDARRLHATMHDEHIDMIFAGLQQAYNLTKEGLEEVIKGLGYSVPEGRRQLGRMNTVNQLLDMRITSNIFVEKQDAETYHKEHPSYHDGVYTLQRTVVPFNGDVNAQEEALKQLLATHADGLSVTWSEPFTIGFSEIAPEKGTIHDTHEKQIAYTGKTIEGFELYRVVFRVEPTLKTFEEAYNEIVEILRKPQEEQLLAAYKEGLEKKLVIEYL